MWHPWFGRRLLVPGRNRRRVLQWQQHQQALRLERLAAPRWRRALWVRWGCILVVGYSHIILFLLSAPAVPSFLPSFLPSDDDDDDDDDGDGDGDDDDDDEGDDVCWFLHLAQKRPVVV